MALIDEGRGWWGQQCPGRPNGLAHVHSADCTDGHTRDQCCECGERARPVRVAEAPPVPFSVADRLREMGIGPSKVESVQDADDILREPVMITGQGPQGSHWARGRGEFTARDAHRTSAWVDFLDWLARRG